MKLNAYVAAAALLAAGCASYSWKASVPEDMRTVDVPVFRNESSVTELGGEMSAQVARELQREGTFRIARPDDAAVEVQGLVKKASAALGGGNMKTGEYLKGLKEHGMHSRTLFYRIRKDGDGLSAGRRYSCIRVSDDSDYHRAALQGIGASYYLLIQCSYGSPSRVQIHQGRRCSCRC